MATVRLILYDWQGAEVACRDIDGPTLLDAATDAAAHGMASDLDFHVVESEDAEIYRLYWVGRRAQKCTREEARAILARKGL
jgi:hypothetical protein